MKERQESRIDRILQHELFRYHLEENRKAEAERVFCRHDMNHFLDVARIGTILDLEQELGLNREWIYAAALLHDLGKHIQYESGQPHELASAEIAPKILANCGFGAEEADRIVDAIRNHRNAAIAGSPDLRGVLYRADKASRACFACAAEQDCNWKGEKKNLTIKY